MKNKHLEDRGGKFAGPRVRRLLPSLSSVVMDYLASLKSLHDVCMAVELVADWPDYIERFRELFLVLYHQLDQMEMRRR